MAKEVFDQSLDEMLEFDSSLNVNDLMEKLPAIETTIEEEPKKDEDKNSLKNINDVLAKQDIESKKDNKKVDDIIEDVKKDDAPASLVKPTDNIDDASFTVIFAKDLVAQGLLSSFDEKKFVEQTKELGDAEALRNIIKEEIEANILAAKSDLDEGYQTYLNLIGKGVQPETVGSLIELKTRFDTIKIEELTKEENTELRKQVMTDYFKLTTSMSDTKIAKTVQSSIDLGDDIEDSKEYLTSLKDLVKTQIDTEEQEAEKQQKLQLEENRRNIEVLKENINSLEEIIPGVPINKQTKQQMFESITKPVQDNKGRTTNALWAKRTEDPQFFDERLAYLYATGFFDKNKPWTKATQTKITKEISTLELALQRKNNTESKTGGPVLRTPELDKTSKDNIDAMRGIFTR